MKKVIRTLYPTEVLDDEGTDYEFVDAVEVRECIVRSSFWDDERADARYGKRNNKRHSFYRPPSYRGETRVEVVFLERPRRRWCIPLPFVYNRENFILDESPSLLGVYTN